MSDILEQTGQSFASIRCIQCDKLLAREIMPQFVEIKCPRCGTLNKVFEQMNEQVIITDRDGRILYMNNSAQVVTGYDLHEAIGKKPSELWGKQMPPEFYKDLWSSVLDSEFKSKPVSMKNRNKKGEFYEVDLIVTAIKDMNGNILFLIGIERTK